MRHHRNLIGGLIVLAVLVAACAPTLQGKVQQAAEIQKGLFDAAQLAAVGVYESTWQVWLSQVRAGTLSQQDYRVKIAALDKKMDNIAVMVQQGKAAQRALIDGLVLLNAGAANQGSILNLQTEFINFVTSVMVAVEQIRTSSK